MDAERRVYVEITESGFPFHYEVVPVPVENLADYLAELPDAVIAYQVFRALPGDGQAADPVLEPLTGVVYPGGEIFDAEQVAGLGGHEMLLLNMRVNGWNRVVRTRTGVWQPLGEGDSTAPSVAPAAGT